MAPKNMTNGLDAMRACPQVELVTDVAVLYVDPRGPYPELVSHWYDESRDGRCFSP